MLTVGFSLGKWLINDPVLQEYFNKNENMDNNFKETGNDSSFTESQCSSANINFKRVLDVELITESDLLVVQFGDLIKLAKSLKPTKRTILKDSSCYG